MPGSGVSHSTGGPARWPTAPGRAAVDRCAARVVDLLRRSARTDTAPTRATTRPGPPGCGRIGAAHNGVLPLAVSGTTGDRRVRHRAPLQEAGSSQSADPARSGARPDAGPGRLRRSCSPRATTPAAAPPRPTRRPGSPWPGADVVVLLGGLPRRGSPGVQPSDARSARGSDPPDRALAAATPVVVVCANGGVVHMPWAERIDAVLGSGWGARPVQATVDVSSVTRSRAGGWPRASPSVARCRRTATSLADRGRSSTARP